MIGAAPIIALDPLPAAPRRALEFGADLALDPTVAGVEGEVWRLTDGLGLDVAVDVMGPHPCPGQRLFEPVRPAGDDRASPEPVALSDLDDASIDAVLAASPVASSWTSPDVDREALRATVRSGTYFGLQSHALLWHLGFRKEHLEQLVRLVSTGRLKRVAVDH